VIGCLSYNSQTKREVQNEEIDDDGSHCFNSGFDG